MKLVDFDGLFDEKLTVYMEENKGKYTETQWEDVIAKLYKKFGDTYVAKVKCTPKEYYEKMTDEELVETLCAHLEEEVPVSEFLCSEIERRDVAQMLAPMLKSGNSEKATYAFNLIGDDKHAYTTYFELLQDSSTDEELKSDITDIFKENADEVKQEALTLYKAGVATESMLEILSRVKIKEEEIYLILLGAFLTYTNIPMHASYLASYGDERALTPLLEKIEDRNIGFVAFQELKYAIEALGGVYDEPRDFSEDKDYLAIESEAMQRANEGKLKN